jgi:hypothetical protein
MPPLTFRLDFKTPELRLLELPVEVRKPDATLVKTAMTSETIDLPAGAYYATTKLPGGQRLVSPFTLADAPQEVVLAPDVEDAPAQEWEAVSHFLGRSAAAQALPPPRLERNPAFSKRAKGGRPGPAPRPAMERAPLLSVFSGNVVRRTHAPEPAAQVLGPVLCEQNRVLQFEVPPNAKLLIVQLAQPGGPVQNMTLPVSPEAGVQVVISRRPGSGFHMETHLKNHAANMLLQYSSYGAVSSAAVASRSQTVDGERLLHDKMSDPIGAVVGAYAILRVGDLARLHEWTAHLRDRFTWLPDGAAIRGEHLARMGRHQEAVEAFADVPGRGLPLFSDGLFYAVERLKLYATRTWTGETRLDTGRAESTLAELQPFALLMRRVRPISTYPGLDVSVPDTEPAPASLMAPTGLDLSQWFDAPRAAGWE